MIAVILFGIFLFFFTFILFPNHNKLETLIVVILIIITGILLWEYGMYRTV